VADEDGTLSFVMLAKVSVSLLISGPTTGKTTPVHFGWSRHNGELLSSEESFKREHQCSAGKFVPIFQAQF